MERPACGLIYHGETLHFNILAVNEENNAESRVQKRTALLIFSICGLEILIKRAGDHAVIQLALFVRAAAV